MRPQNIPFVLSPKCPVRIATQPAGIS